jgi:cysteine-rich repeat protein
MRRPQNVVLVVLPFLLFAFFVSCGIFEQSTDHPADTSLEGREDEPRCGNSVRETNEQCDDGNAASLDGCDSSCRFEQAMRANSLVMLFGTDSLCPANALGSAVGSAAQEEVNKSLRADVASGDITVLFKALDLADLSGQNAARFQLGNLFGKPTSGRGYNGEADLDWWYDIDGSSADEDRVPKERLAGSISRGALRAGPGAISIYIGLGGDPTLYSVKNAVVRGATGNVNAPKTSAGTTPGHLAKEHLDPALKSFSTVSDGRLCGEVTAGSLGRTPVPEALRVGGANECNERYTDRHTFLDVVVSGCTVFIVSAINPTQPDKYFGTAPGGGRYVFSHNSANQVSGCTDGNGRKVAFQQCLDNALYSSYFAFTAGRVIPRMPPPPPRPDAGTPDAGLSDGGLEPVDGGFEGDAGTSAPDGGPPPDAGERTENDGGL